MSTPQEKQRFAIQRTRGEYALWVRAHVAAAEALRALGRRIERGPPTEADDARMCAAIEKRRRKRIRNADRLKSEVIRGWIRNSETALPTIEQVSEVLHGADDAIDWLTRP